MKNESTPAVIVVSTILTSLVLVFAIVLAATSCNKPSSIDPSQQVFEYTLEKGQNGITRLIIHSDSTATIDYVFNDTTYHLDSISAKEYETIASALYENPSN